MAEPCIQIQRAAVTPIITITGATTRQMRSSPCQPRVTTTLVLPGKAPPAGEPVAQGRIQILYILPTTPMDDENRARCECSFNEAACNRQVVLHTRYCAMCSVGECRCSCAPCDPSTSSDTDDTRLDGNKRIFAFPYDSTTELPGQAHNICISGWKPGRTQHCFPSPEEMWGDGGLAEQQWLCDDAKEKQYIDADAESRCPPTAPFSYHAPSASPARSITGSGTSRRSSICTYATTTEATSSSRQGTDSQDKDIVELRSRCLSSTSGLATDCLISKSCGARPQCSCSCRCQRRPGCRVQCPACLKFVVPGCCWLVYSTCCHRCSTTEPEPEPAVSTQRRAPTLHPTDAATTTLDAHVGHLLSACAHHVPCPFSPYLIWRLSWGRLGWYKCEHNPPCTGWVHRSSYHWPECETCFSDH